MLPSDLQARVMHAFHKRHVLPLLPTGERATTCRSIAASWLTLGPGLRVALLWLYNMPYNATIGLGERAVLAQVLLRGGRRGLSGALHATPVGDAALQRCLSDIVDFVSYAGHLQKV